MDGARVPSPPLPPLRRRALVIANGVYDSDELIDLVAPAHDLERMVAMLGDPDICGFAVSTLRDATSAEVSRALDEVFSAGDQDDFLLIYFSGHGVKDGNGRLYFATRDTDLDLLPSSSVSAKYLRTLSDDAECNRQVVILDCCNSGAYDKGPAGGVLIDTDPDMLAALPTGRFILTASRRAESARQRRIESDAIDGSVFTSALVEGIVTGRADTASTGLISVEDAYRYAYRTVRHQPGRQHPQLAIKAAEGTALLLARNPVGVEPGSQRVSRIVALLADEDPEIQRSALTMLGRLVTDEHPGIAAAARRALRAQVDGVDRELAALAGTLLPKPRPKPSGATGAPEPGPEPGPAFDDDFLFDDPPPPPWQRRDPGGDGRDEAPEIDFEEFADLRNAADPQGVFGPRRVLPLEDEPTTLVARYLFPTERYRGEWRRHKIYLFRAIALTGVAAAGALLAHVKKAETEALLARPLPDWVPFDIPPAVHGVPRATVLMWLLIAIAVLGLRQQLNWPFARVVLTNKRIMLVRGLLRRRVTAVPLLRATDLRFRQSALGQLGNWGTMTIYQGMFPARRFRYVPTPNEIYLRIMEETYEPQAVEARLGRDLDDDDA
ncbi:hypothetical protein BJY16_004016 [Actinoplanes octamycinicus]|uniref:Caspase domain-containing protein n=1 Tax=Actinoplanes octamycinicus TaxID=135948 RepID=A0A7W7GYP1_9ACTN|nr:caspase family protein [Actinoplanes octamycinicus]MBB4740557.1 hypothetical protein [Actinoplanes octamycinicus]GIE59815.1 hypothetical protein Aoc01nite_52170 [Actinoplanes octamycinicus]